MWQERDTSDLDLSDDEELTQSFDIHSLIISSLQQEPMFTADEVINEIEGMMEDSEDDEVSSTDHGLGLGPIVVIESHLNGVVIFFLL